MEEVFAVLGGAFAGFMLANVMLRPLRLEAKKARVIGSDEAIWTIIAIVDVAGGKVTIPAHETLRMDLGDRVLERWDDPITGSIVFQTRRKVL